MTTDEFLSRFTAVRAAGPGKWTAQCPAHDDRSRDTLSLALGREDRRLVKCWAGCETGAVVAAVGLSLGDLFPDGGTAQDTALPPTYRQMVAHEIRAERARRERLYGPYREFWLGAELIRDERLAAACARRIATALGPDHERTWRLLELTAACETSAAAAEAEQDEQIRALRRV